MELLFSTPHGSRLYGLHHANSDHDRMEVYGFNKFRPKQKIIGDDDVVKASLDRFLLYCDKGVPQYLEAMFSEQATVNRIEFITDTYMPNMTHMRDTYFRTIKSFWMFGVENDDHKRRRHALRLLLNLREAHERGRFNPTLTAEQARQITVDADRLTELPDF